MVFSQTLDEKSRPCVSSSFFPFIFPAALIRFRSESVFQLGFFFFPHSGTPICKVLFPPFTLTGPTYASAIFSGVGSVQTIRGCYSSLTSPQHPPLCRSTTHQFPLSKVTSNSRIPAPPLCKFFAEVEMQGAFFDFPFSLFLK